MVGIGNVDKGVGNCPLIWNVGNTVAHETPHGVGCGISGVAGITTVPPKSSIVGMTVVGIKVIWGLPSQPPQSG